MIRDRLPVEDRDDGRREASGQHPEPSRTLDVRARVPLQEHRGPRMQGKTSHAGRGRDPQHLPRLPVRIRAVQADGEEDDVRRQLTHDPHPEQKVDHGRSTRDEGQPDGQAEQAEDRDGIRHIGQQRRQRCTGVEERRDEEQPEHGCHATDDDERVQDIAATGARRSAAQAPEEEPQEGVRRQEQHVERTRQRHRGRAEMPAAARGRRGCSRRSTHRTPPPPR